MDVGESVDLLSCKIRLCGHEILILRVQRQFIGHGHAVDGRSDHGMIHPVFDLLSEHIYSRIEFF